MERIVSILRIIPSKLDVGSKAQRNLLNTAHSITARARLITAYVNTTPLITLT